MRGLNACGSRRNASSQPRDAVEAIFDSSGAEPFPFPSTVWQVMQRDSETSFLPLAALPAGSAAAASIAARELLRHLGAKRKCESSSIAWSVRWKFGIVAFGSIDFGSFSQRFTHSPPVLSGSVASGGASERNASCPRTAWQA